MMKKEYIALVTGASSGIGLETARQFVEAGATVVGIGRNKKALVAAANEVGERFIPKVCDVSEEPQIARLASDFAKQYEHLDVLVNNAGRGGRKHILQMTEADFDFYFGTMLKGPMFFVKHFEPLLRKSPAPVIVNIASDAAWGVGTDNFLYSSAKLALEKFTRHMVHDLPGIRSNTILPGLIDTPVFKRSLPGLTDQQLEEIFKGYLKMIPADRIGKPEDIANCVLFLSSEKASYINGAAINIDGGLLCQRREAPSSAD